MLFSLQVGLFLCGIVLSRIFYLIVLHPLASYPGPRLAKLTNFWSGPLFHDFIRGYDMLEINLTPDLGDSFPFLRVRKISLTLSYTGDTENLSATALTVYSFLTSTLLKLFTGPQIRSRRAIFIPFFPMGNLMTRTSSLLGLRVCTEMQSENSSPLL